MDILKAEGRRILEEFQLASKQGEGTAQEIADFREHAVQDFISRFYPANHIVSKGKITDLNGLQSNSIDCLILNPAHPKLIDAKGKFRMIFADGCDAAIELKPNLGRADELIRSLRQCLSIKKVMRSKSPLLRTSRLAPEIVMHSLYIPFYVLAVHSFAPNKLYDLIVEFYSLNKTSREEQIDGIFIINNGILKSIKHKERNFYGVPPPIGENDGWYFETWQDATTLGILFSLEHSFASAPTISEPIMRRVLAKLGNTNVTQLETASKVQPPPDQIAVTLADQAQHALQEASPVSHPPHRQVTPSPAPELLHMKPESPSVETFGRIVA